MGHILGSTDLQQPLLDLLEVLQLGATAVARQYQLAVLVDAVGVLFEGEGVNQLKITGGMWTPLPLILAAPAINQ